MVGHHAIATSGPAERLTLSRLPDSTYVTSRTYVLSSTNFKIESHNYVPAPPLPNLLFDRCLRISKVKDKMGGSLQF